MKSKPISHKSDNTFKFESFNDRLSKINVSVLHNLKRGVNGVSDDPEITCFAITLDKWFDLNCSEDFEQLKHSIGTIDSVKILPQIVHRKNELFDILIEQLKKSDNLALNVVLELIVALARDLNTDFYPYFDRIIVSLIDLLNTTNVETIENTFICLTFLFKYLRKYIVLDFENNYKLFAVLLNSKKEFIRKFTSESLSFLIRKTKNKSFIIDILFESVDENPKLVEGVGQLLFESIKGLNNNFQISAETLIPLIFNKYLVIESDCLDQTIALMFSLLVEHISKNNSQLIWTTLLFDTNLRPIALKRVIPILNLVIAFKNCKLVQNPSQVVHYLIIYLDNCLDESHKNNILIGLQYLLNNCFQNISVEVIDLINSRIFSDSLSIIQVLEFTKSIFNCPIFERIILNRVLNFCLQQFKLHSYESNEFSICLKFLTQLILTKRRRPIYGTNTAAISKYILKFSEDICQILLNLINTTNDLKTIWLAFICLPNLIPITNEKAIYETIGQTVMKLESRFNCSYSENCWFGYITIEAIIALIILKNGRRDPIKELSQQFFIDLINTYPSNTEILHAFDLYLTFNKDCGVVLDISVLENIYYESLEQNLSSFCKIRRLLSLHLLTLFEPPLPPSEDINYIKASILNICFNSESIPNDLREYRTKLKYLQSLDYSFVKQSIPLTTSGGLNFELMPIHFLFGSLYNNLSLLWLPIQKLIVGYAKGYEEKKPFLMLLFNHLKQTTREIASNKSFNCVNYDSDINNYLNSKVVTLSDIDKRPDFSNHRLLILKTIDLFPEIVEPSNREFVDIFFDFIENEMNSYLTFGQNSREDIRIENQWNDNQMDIDLTEEQNNDNLKINNSIISRKTVYKTLFTFLSIFSKFKNPKALYRGKELLDFYLNSLSSPDSEIQKHSFNCILTYYNSFLSPFHDNFLRLIDEKTFKSEIYSFFLNNENEENVMNSKNRSNIVPLLMRILYGKMISTNGNKRHGKSNADFKRSIILKVLSAFDENELILFMDFVFEPLMEFVGRDYESLSHLIKSKVKIEECICLRQFQALTTTLHFILKHFGNHSQQITSYIYKVLIIASTVVTHLLSSENRQLINEHSIIRLKTIRSNCFKVAKSFFELFDNYCYSSAQIDALFECLIWPMLPNLDTESLSSPSPLLNFFVSLSENSRYFKMFGKYHILNKNLTPINVIIKLFGNSKAQPSVITAVTQIIDNLLSLENYSTSEQNIEISEISVNNFTVCELKNTDTCNIENMSVGALLLFPFASQILKRIQISLESIKSGGKRRKASESGFTSQELNILSHLSCFVNQSNDCQNLIILLIHSINVKNIEEQKELQTIKVLSHLVKNVKLEEVNDIYKCLIPLFGTVSNCMSRTELCRTFEILSETKTDLIYLSQLINNINAFNPKFPEEPDYAKRIDSFKRINLKIETISRNEFNYEFISIIIYNCIHFIRFNDDMAIRESASNTINNLLIKLTEFDDNQLFQTFAIKTLLYSEITKGFRDKSEAVRHQFIEVLLCLINVCAHKHPVLQQLAQLSNKEDEEIDFWQNIKHIQIHRRSRALTRLSKNDDLLKTFSNRIFSNFLLPLTTSFLSDIHYTKQTGLLNSSIEALGAFAKYSHWSKYYSLLKHYINLLITQKGEQKINIRIIFSILDNYSFSNSSILSHSSDIEEEPEEENIKNEINLNNEVKQYNSTIDKINDQTLTSVLPLLHKCLHQKSHIDFAYDSMKNEFPEDEDIQRASIALAIIKLLKSMNASEEALNANIPSVFLRLCQFLQSRAQSIRDSARNTFVKVMECLGPKYFKNAFMEMRSTLSKGYQRHVFIYTAHAILSHLRPQLSSGDLDNCLECLHEICGLELFGNLSEEKEVSKITSKLKEAKKCKSFDILQIMATFVTEKCLTQLILPLKSTLLETHSHKVIRKVSQSFSKVGQGLIANSSLNEKTLMAFIYGLINDSIPDLQLKNENICKKEIKTKRLRPDSYLIAKPIYHRTERVVKISGTSNLHIIIEFALNCFLALIKQNRMQSSNGEHLSLIDPYISLLENLLQSKDPKLTTTSLQCLHILYTKFEVLPAFSNSSENIMKTLFVLLNKYSKIGSNDREDDYLQLISLCFKTLSLFIRDRTDVHINDEQMAVLLSYVEQDLHNNSRQSTAVVIMKSILSRKYNSPVLHRIMKKVTEMAITSDIDNIRNNCNQLCVKYLTEYSNENSLRKRITFIVLHLEYEKPLGRESALYILSQVLSSLSYEFLSVNIAMIFVPLSSRLINESSSECKKLVTNSLLKLLKRVTEKERNMLFNDLIIPWLQEEGVLQRLLASHLCSIFLTVEEKDFSNRLNHLMPFLSQQLDPNRYSETTDISLNSNDGSVKCTDSLVYQHLNLFIKLMKANPNFIEKMQFIEDINSIFDYILSYHLLHPHIWVRVISVQIFGQLFSQFSTECLANSINNPLESNQFLLIDTKQKLTQLGSKFCLIFRDIYDSNILSDQLIKNLVYISRVFIQTSAENTIISSFKWLTNKLIFEVKYELKNSPKLTQKRISIFKWMAAVAVELANERLEIYLPYFLPLLCREDMSANNTNDQNELSVLTKQVLQIFKNIIGTEKFSDFYSKAKTELTLKKLERKKNNAISSINEVVISTKRKMKKNNKSLVSKKKKISNFKN